MRSSVRAILLVRIPLLIFLLVAGIFPLRAQEPLDTLAQQAVADTSRRVSGVDTLVVYNARDSVTYSLSTRYMRLYGSGDIKYRAIGLKADRIAVNWDNATLNAEGVPDTSDPKGSKITGAPVMNDEGEKYEGTEIGYNFRTKKGRISVGETEMEEGYYHGGEIKKVAPDILYVEDGRYTTCSLDHPHFFFLSPKMKVIPRDVVVAEPVYFYVADVPLFALPFGVFPNRSGRRSGIIAPAYGEDARFGRYFSHFGYYWAASDYFDVATTFDWYTRGGWANRSLLRYKLRYNFEGNLSAGINRRYEGEIGDPDRSERKDYNVQITHHQDIDPTMRADVNFTFTSGTYYRNFSQSLNDILRQNIVSNATLSKTWTGSNSSLSIAVLRDQNLVSDDLSETLPSISFNQGTLFPFRKKSGSGSDPAWYETIGLSYRANGTNHRQKTSLTLDSVKTADGVFADVKEFRRTNTQNLNQSLGLSFSPRLGPVTLSPSLNFADNRTFTESRTPVKNSADSTLEFVTDRPRSASGSLSAGISTSTRFYGIMQPNVWGVTAFRHTLNPTVSISYNKQVYGTTLGPYALNASMNVQNIFEIKYQESDTAKEQKIQLMNVGAALSYNFRAPERKLSDLSVNYRTSIGRILDVSATTVYSFYLFDRTLERRVDKFLMKEKGYLADLTSISFSLGTSLSGQRKQGSTPPPAEETVETAVQGVDMTGGFYQNETPDFDIPWDLTLNFNFSQIQQDPRVKIRSVSLQAQLSFNLTEKWKISASGNYDLAQKQFAAPSVQISRDLHCWLMNFTWVPLGPYRYYRLEIRVKAPQLQDIKVTKQGSERGVYY